MNIKKRYEVVIIGGGFYGSMIALFMKKYFNKILLIEKEDTILKRASYLNQGRVHNGYHYPRNFITGLRSHINYGRFIKDFKKAIDNNFLMIYGIALHTSKVTSYQFTKFCKQIGAPLRPIPANFRRLFNKYLLEDLFVVDEVVFNAIKLRKILLEKLEIAGIKVLLREEVFNIKTFKEENLILSLHSGKTVISTIIINCTYSQINTILANSKLPLLPFKYEYAEMPLVHMPEILRKIGITIMDGPFFSLMPFPAKKLHSFHHVRYTPHFTFLRAIRTSKEHMKGTSKFIFMRKDAERYIPALKQLQYVGSLYEVKTVLLQNENNDGRPILFKKNYDINNFHIVMGGKIDNIYDIFNELQKIYGTESSLQIVAA